MLSQVILTKEMFKEIYEETIAAYDGNQLQARRELLALLPAVLEETHPHTEPAFIELQLTYMFCDLFSRYGRDIETAWRCAKQICAKSLSFA